MMRWVQDHDLILASMIMVLVVMIVLSIYFPDFTL